MKPKLVKPQKGNEKKKTVNMMVKNKKTKTNQKEKKERIEE